MVPLAAFTKMRETKGPVMIVRYNMYPAAPSTAIPRPASARAPLWPPWRSWSDSELAFSMKYEWTELALLQLQTGNTALMAFALAVVLVFLVLAAQYESWSLPLAVILVVPMCLLFSVAGVVMARMDINIFTQVGFVVLVGLACKNAILIVEFAKAQSEAGVPRFEATLDACKLRLRPIIMTSFAFILGVVPLMLSHGAGAEMRLHAGHGRVQRHARRDVVRHLPHTDLLLHDPVGQGRPVPCPVKWQLRARTPSANLHGH